MVAITISKMMRMEMASDALQLAVKAVGVEAMTEAVFEYGKN